MGEGSRFHGVDAVVFDFDGTLAETNIDFAGIRARLRDFFVSRDCWDESLFQRYILEMIDSVCERLSPGEAADVRDESMRIVAEAELDACRRGRPYPGVPDALDELSRRGYRIGIFTRNSRSGCAAVLEQHRLPHSVIVTRDDVENVKPHPEHLRLTLAGLGCTPESTVVVGDHQTDVETARAVGAHAIGVLTTNCTRETFLAAGADLVLDSAAELPEVLPRQPG